MLISWLLKGSAEGLVGANPQETGYLEQLAESVRNSE